MRSISFQSVKKWCKIKQLWKQKQVSQQLFLEGSKKIAKETLHKWKLVFKNWHQ